jgi:hypothetical protein
MRSLASISASLALVCAGTVALGYEPKPTTLKVNPFEKAKALDWAVYRLVSHTQDGTNPPKEKTLVLRDKVEKTDDDFATLGTEILLKKDDLFSDAFRKIARKGPVEVVELFRFTGGDVLSGVPKDGARVTRFETKEAKRKVSEKEFACSLVSFTVESNDHAPTEASLWLSTDVKAKGIVAYEASTKEKKEGALVDRKLEWTIVAYGNDKTTEWGTVPADLTEIDKKRELPTDGK